MAVRRGALPQAGAVEMERDPPLPRHRLQLPELLPGGELPARLPDRKLGQDGGERRRHGGEVFGQHRLARRPDQGGVETVEVGVAALLVEFDVGGGMHADGTVPGPIRPDAQGDLLRHGPARHEAPRLVPEPFGDLRLERLDQLPFAVAVERHVPFLAPCRDVGQHPGGRHVAVAVDRTTGGTEGISIIHGAHPRRHEPIP